MASVHMPAVNTVTISQLLTRRVPGAGVEGTAMNLPFDWTIRNAVPEDAAAIGGILRNCWPDDTPDIQRITRLIRSGQHVTQCAFNGVSCVGFVDAFRTVSASGSGRWEVDVLAVHASARGQGVGKALVAASLEAAPPGVGIARGLIRIGNHASEGAFSGAGFQFIDLPLALYVASPLAGVNAPKAGFVVPVETFTYSGLWLEARPSLDVLMAARVQAAALGVEQAGTLAAEAHAELCKAAGYRRAGEFRWWLRVH